MHCISTSPHLMQHLDCASVVKLFFSYSPPSGTHPPPPLTPLRGSRFRVVFRSFSSRVRVDFESRLENDSKSTRKRSKNDSKSTPSVVVGDESRRVGCS